MMFRAGEHDTQSWRPRAGAVVAQIALAVGISVVLVIYLTRWKTFYTETNTDTDIYVSSNAQLPRLAILLAVPVVLFVVWTLRRTRTAASALVALASIASVAYFTAAFDWGTAPVSMRGEFIFAAAAAVAIAGIAVHGLVSRQTSA